MGQGDDPYGKGDSLSVGVLYENIVLLEVYSYKLLIGDTVSTGNRKNGGLGS